MNSAIKRLKALRVADVMNKEVVSVSSTDSMEHAARQLVKHSISGVTVLDSQHACTGILSALDFVKQHARKCEMLRAKDPLIAEQAAQFEDVDKGVEGDVFGEDLVFRHMTPNVQSITGSQTLLSAAQLMCARHVHRLPVLDERGRIDGIISALDIVGAIVKAIDEKGQQ